MFEALKLLSAFNAESSIPNVSLKTTGSGIPVLKPHLGSIYKSSIPRRRLFHAFIIIFFKTIVTIQSSSGFRLRLIFYSAIIILNNLFYHMVIH